MALPVDPYYKTESDVATTEILRYFTTIPVPVVYAFDSSANNPLELEWILMAKVGGKRLDEVWTSLDYDSKLRLARTTASWSAQLASISSSKIGSIYMRYTATDLEFHVGRSVVSLLSQENRLTYEAFRGPFISIQEYYNAVLTVAS